MDTLNAPTVSKPFHTESRANNSHNKENSPAKFDIKDGLKFGIVHSNTLTVPRSPNLRTKYRSKPTTLLPTEEYKIREMQNYKFKANPVDRRIFGNRNFGISKVQKPKLIEPHSPAITKPRLTPPHSGEKYQREFYEQVRKEREHEKEITQFYAQPLPNFEPEFPRKLEYPPSTEPIGFSLLTNTRMEERHIYGEHRRLREKKAEPRNAKEIRRLSVPIRQYSPKIIQPSSKKPTRPVSPMIGGNYEYSFKDSIFDLDNMDDISNTSNVESLDSIRLYSSFKADQVTNAALTPIDECETEFQDIIMTDSVSSEQVQAEEDIMKYVDLD